MNGLKVIMIPTLAVTLLFSGCGSSETSQQTSQTPASSNSQAANSTGNRGNFTRPDISGEITAINGNDTTLKIIEMPDFRGGNGNRQNGDGQRGNGQNGDGQRGNRQRGNEQDGNVQSDNIQNGNQALGNGQNNDGQQGEGAENRRAFRGQNGTPMTEREVKYTGESQTISIPAGTPIATMFRSDKGMENKNLEVKDLKTGDVLQIWYSDKEKKTIARISVRTNARSNGQ